MLLNQVELLHRNGHSSDRVRAVRVTSSDVVCQPPKTELKSHGPAGGFCSAVEEDYPHEIRFKEIMRDKNKTVL